VRTSIASLRRRKAAGEKFTVVTAYDYTSARLVDASSVDAILVGDSLGMVMQGHDSTLPVTVEQMIYHAQMVRRGAQRALIVVDLPFTATASPEDAVRAATQIMAETGAQSVKIEGGARIAPLVRQLVANGIPVMGHLGFTPQSVNTIGLRVQGRDEAGARELLADALALQEAGVWSVVLELVPAELAAAVTDRLEIPTVGIGAGAGCDAQVQVWHDLLGLYEEFVPKHARQFRVLGAEVRGALDEYSAAVADGSFPTEANASSMDAATLERALGSGAGAGSAEDAEGPTA
jgi:3-methyl-2-oxobutanoate hydroxymethyltransferase